MSKAQKKATRKRRYFTPRDKDHDALTKVGLSDIEGVKGLLQTELPSEYLKNLDLNTLERVSDSYTDEHLKNSFADKAFSCKSLEGEKVLIAFMVEHKSYVPTEPIYVQLLQYFIGYWRDCTAAGQSINCIIPIVIYHGEADWTPNPFYDYFNLQTAIFNKFIPHFEIIYINLRSLPKEVIVAHQIWGKLRAVFLALKYAFNKDILLTEFEFILKFVTDKYGNVTDVEMRFSMAVIEYIQRKTQMTEEEYLDKIDNFSQNPKEMATSTYHNIFRNAQKRGLEEGREEKNEEFVTNLILGTDFNDEKIASLANVTLDFVKQIKEKLAKSDNNKRDEK